MKVSSVTDREVVLLDQIQLWSTYHHVYGEHTYVQYSLMPSVVMIICTYISHVRTVRLHFCFTGDR